MLFCYAIGSVTGDAVNNDNDIRRYVEFLFFPSGGQTAHLSSLYHFPHQRYNPEDQPWLLQEDGPGGRKYKGVKEGGVTENTSYYIFQQAGSGAFEAFPIEVRGRKSMCVCKGRVVVGRKR